MRKNLLMLVSLLIVPLCQAQENSCIEADNATHITGPGTFTVGDIDGDAPPLVCAGSGFADNGEWFAYSPSVGVFATVSSDLVVNGDKDTRFQVFIGDCGSLVCYAGDDDGGVLTGSNSSSRLSLDTFTAVPGETYYIVWEDRFSTGDNFTFEITEDPLPPVSFEVQSFNAGGTRRALVDMNGDFLDDIVSISQNSNAPSQAVGVNVFYQQNDGTFSSINNYPFTPTFAPSWSLAAGDYNGDGYNDLVFGSTTGVAVVESVPPSSGTDPDGYFLANSDSGVFTQRTNFVDINNDGDLDIFVCHDQAPNTYYLNNVTVNGTPQAGLSFFQGADPDGVSEGLGLYPSGGNYGSIWIDYDNDNDIDLFLSKCGGEIERRSNQLFRNNGSGSFTRVTPNLIDEDTSNDFDPTGLSDPIQTWSSAWADFDNDGDMDVFVGSFAGNEDHKLMKNRSEVPLDSNGWPEDGLPLFEDISVSSGVDLLTKTGVENTAADFNNDGFIDIISNGKVLLNNGDLTFTELTSVVLPSSYAVGDLNNDGYLDLYGSALYYNRTNTYINNNWIKINTIGVISNKNGIGARVEIHTSGVGIEKQIRDVRSGEGFRYMGSLNTHFGIGSETEIDLIRVIWPSGEIDEIENPNINESLTIIEGTNTLSNPSSEKTDLILYPNPTKSILNLNATYDLSNTIYSVFDMSGRRVLNAKLNSNSIDVSDLATGNYLLRIFTQDKISTQRFIKN